MKLKCSRCKEEKDVSCFSKSKTIKRGYSHNCKPCANILNVESLRRHPEKWKARREAAEAKIKERYKDWKRERGCRCCPEKEPVALCLHHLDPTTKEDSPSRMYATWKAFLAEADKCVVLCMNCHAKVHAGIIEL